MDIVDCRLSFSSCNKDGSVKRSIPGLKKESVNSTESPESHKEGVLYCEESQCAGPEVLPPTATEPTILQIRSSHRNQPSPTSLSPNTTSPPLSQNQSSSYYSWKQQSTIDYPSDEDPPVQDAPLLPHLLRMSASFPSFDDDQSNTSTVTKPSLGFLSCSREHDIQATMLKMRQEVLKSLKTDETEASKTNILHPIYI